jgi:hypothetical protein
MSDIGRDTAVSAVPCASKNPTGSSTGETPNAVNLAFVVSPRQRAPYKGVAQSMTSCENGVA